MATIKQLTLGGTTYNIEDATLAQKKASATELGLIKVGTTLSIDTDGVLNATAYELPIATATVLGGVKVADDSAVSIDANGFLGVKNDSHTHTTANVTGLDTALANKLETSLKGAANGLAELGSDGKVPSAQLPSYVDDVVEGYYNVADGKFYQDSEYTQEITPETGKIYVDLTTNKTYRWGGSVYVEISASLALGETETTAYRGDRGRIAYDHSQLADGSNPHATTFANIIDNIATADRLGGVKQGTNITIAADGTISATDTIYTLPAATTSTLGGIKVGANLTVTAEGVLDATDTTYSEATTSIAGLMSSTDKTKLNGIEAEANKYVLPPATASILGGVKQGTNITIDADGTINATDTIYTLPAATTSVLGGVKQGSNVSIASDGTISTTFTYYAADGRLDLGNVTLG